MPQLRLNVEVTDELVDFLVERFGKKEDVELTVYFRLPDFITSFPDEEEWKGMKTESRVDWYMDKWKLSERAAKKLAVLETPPGEILEMGEYRLTKFDQIGKGTAREILAKTAHLR